MSLTSDLRAHVCTHARSLPQTCTCKYTTLIPQTPAEGGCLNYKPRQPRKKAQDRAVPLTCSSIQKPGIVGSTGRQDDDQAFERAQNWGWRLMLKNKADKFKTEALLGLLAHRDPRAQEAEAGGWQV